MGMQIITGYTGTEHIQPRDDAAFFRGIFGDGDFVLNTGAQFAATIVSANEVKIADGDLIMQGRHSRIDSDSFESVTIENGTAGMMRNDLICARWEKNATTNIESCTLVVKKGTAATTAADPTYATGNIDDDEVREMPLYRVRLNGINLEGIDKLFDTVDSIVGLESAMNLFTANMTNQFNAFINSFPEFLYSGKPSEMPEETAEKILEYGCIIVKKSDWFGLVMNRTSKISFMGFRNAAVQYYDDDLNPYKFFVFEYRFTPGGVFAERQVGMKLVSPYIDSNDFSSDDSTLDVYGIK